MLAALLSRISLTVWKWLAIAVAVAAVLAGARSAGRSAERVDNLKKRLDDVEKANGIDKRVSALPFSAALNELRKDWSR